MNKSLEMKLTELKELLFSQPEIKEYFRLRKALEKDRELMEIEAQIRFHQREMSENIANDEKYFQEKGIYETLKKEYDSHPIVANYEAIKIIVYDMLQQIKDIIE